MQSHHVFWGRILGVLRSCTGTSTEEYADIVVVGVAGHAACLLTISPGSLVLWLLPDPHFDGQSSSNIDTLGSSEQRAQHNHAVVKFAPFVIYDLGIIKASWNKPSSSSDSREARILRVHISLS